MPTANDVIAHSLSTSQELLQQHTADPSPPGYLHHPTAQSNCAAWTAGHLTLADRRALQHFTAELPPLPARSCEGGSERFAPSDFAVRKRVWNDGSSSPAGRAPARR